MPRRCGSGRRNKSRQLSDPGYDDYLMRLIWSCALLAAMTVLSASDASAQSQRGTIAVSVRVVRNSAPQTQTQTQTQTRLTETDGTSSQPATDASGQPVTTRSDVVGNVVAGDDVTGIDADGNIFNVGASASGDTSGAPAATPLNRFRVLTINY